MSVLKKYNEGTAQWEAVVVGKQGPSGTVAVTAPLTNSGTSTAAVLGVDYSALQYGQNVLINGAMDFWQRGDSFTNAAGVYTADRWNVGRDGSTTVNITKQTFTPGAAPVAGYEGQYFMRMAGTVVADSTYYAIQRIEDVRTFAGQTATLSFWAKSSTPANNYPLLVQSFGSGGSSSVIVTNPMQTIGTSWQRYTTTFTVPSISGKTIGGNNLLEIQVIRSNTSATIDLWGVQFELGSTATSFKRSVGTIQGELAACQRYYFRMGGNASYEIFAFGGNPYSSTNCQFHLKLPVTMRVTPTSIDWNQLQANDNAWGGVVTAVSVSSESGKDSVGVNATVASGYTTNRPTRLLSNGTTAGYLGFSAEL